VILSSDGFLFHVPYLALRSQEVRQAESAWPGLQEGEERRGANILRPLVLEEQEREWSESLVLI